MYPIKGSPGKDNPAVDINEAVDSQAVLFLYCSAMTKYLTKNQLKQSTIYFCL